MTGASVGTGGPVKVELLNLAEASGSYPAGAPDPAEAAKSRFSQTLKRGTSFLGSSRFQP